MFAVARFRVEEYDAWKDVFDGHVDARIRYGAKGHRIFRSEEDGNALTLMIEVVSHGGAKGLLEYDVSLLDALRRGGVEGGAHGGKWRTDYLDEVNAADYTAWPYR